jgi:hypothetical protein
VRADVMLMYEEGDIDNTLAQDVADEFSAHSFMKLKADVEKVLTVHSWLLKVCSKAGVDLTPELIALLATGVFDGVLINILQRAQVRVEAINLARTLPKPLT